MSRNTMSFALPPSMRSYIDERVRGGEYGNTSEYLRDLIRRDQQAEEARRFRMLIAEGLESGEGRPLTSEVVDELRAWALGRAV
ncbi:MAG: type II toxin-antitoxin system ParD family antitoxin [Acidimicrobiaceae bacterium]|nr:type II toxin-antitoxin system ParD family antitoxin [Acidimicrobiaceae bacterium]